MDELDSLLYVPTHFVSIYFSQASGIPYSPVPLPSSAHLLDRLINDGHWFDDNLTPLHQLGAILSNFLLFFSSLLLMNCAPLMSNVVNSPNPKGQTIVAIAAVRRDGKDINDLILVLILMSAVLRIDDPLSVPSTPNSTDSGRIPKSVKWRNEY
jgi:hypothetical protein